MLTYQIPKNMIKTIIRFFVFLALIHCKLFSADFRNGIQLESEDISMARFFVHQTYFLGDAISRGSGPGIGFDDMTLIHGRDVYKLQWFREKVQSVNDHVGFLAIRTHHINEDNERIILAVNRVFAAFRGSLWVNDWLRNGEFSMEAFQDDEGSMVHRGFYDRYRAIQDGREVGITAGEIAETNGFVRFLHKSLLLNGIIKENCEFIFTGHSTGAALATLACSETASNFNFIENQAKLITFSSPMVGNRAFVNNVKEQLGELNIHRFYCRTDIVPYLPLAQFGYEHVGVGIPFLFLEVARYDYDDTHADVLNFSVDTALRYRNIINGFGLSLLSIGFVKKSHAMPNRELTRSIFVRIKDAHRRGIAIDELGNSTLDQANRGIFGEFINRL